MTNFKKETKLYGICGSPGFCIGKAYLVDKEGVDVIEKYYIRENDITAEINRFKAAVQNAANELAQIIKNIPEEFQENAHILEAQMALYKDKMLYDKTIDLIEKECVNAEWALKKIIEKAKTMFQSISDPYLKSRGSDIVHISDKIIHNLVGFKNENISEINKRVILIAKDLSPAETSQIQLERIKGFVTDLGGKASHTGIIARSLGIPAVIGIENATKEIKNDDIIIVDGKAGTIIINPSDDTIIKYERLNIKYTEYQAVITRKSYMPAKTTDGHRFKIMGNIEFPEEIVSVLDHGGDGIGLYRTEFLYLSRTNFPDEDELFEQYKDVAELMEPKPVTIRTLDINGDKALIHHLPEQKEINPALGLRAIRFCYKKPEIFLTQLKAILRASAYGNIRVLFPMISNYNELVFAKQSLNDAKNSLKALNIEYDKNIKVGIMIEVPSAVLIAEHLADLVDFFSIGTNDLIQYSLAIDRGNSEVAYLFEPLHPAVIKMVKYIADIRKKKKIEVHMCGEMAAEPINLPILLGLNLDELSMNPQTIPDIKNNISKLSVKKAKKLINKVLQKKTSEEIKELIMEEYGDILNNNGIFND